MVSAAYGPGMGGGYGNYPPPPSANDQKFAQINQTVDGANQIFRQAMGSSSPQMGPQQAQQAPPEEKGFFGRIKDKISSIF